MLDLIQSILVKIFSFLPDASLNDPVITAVNSAFSVMTPTFAKIDLIFPIYSLFKILLLVLFVEMTLFLITLVLKAITTVKP